MLAPLSPRKHTTINLDNAFFFSPTTPGNSQHSTLSHPLPLQRLPSLPPVRSAHFLPSFDTQHLPPKPSTLPQKLNHSFPHHSLRNATTSSLSLPPPLPPPRLKSASATPLFPQEIFERITDEPLSNPRCIPLPHATKAHTSTDRVTTALPEARPPIDNHGAGYPDVGLSPQRVPLRTHDSPDSWRHDSEARQGRTIGQPPCNPGNDQSNLSNVTGVANASPSPILPSPNPASGNPAPTSFSNSLLPGDPLSPGPALQVEIPETTRRITSVLEKFDRNPERIARDPDISNAHKLPEEEVQAMQHCSLVRRQPSTGTLPSRIDKTGGRYIRTRMRI